MSTEPHIDNLVRHIGLVRDACLLLGKRLIGRRREDFGRDLVARGLIHDVSKFHGIEWDCLHRTNEVPPAELEKAIIQHRQTNDHHPEFWGGIERMPEICIAEMVCDWYARSQEFGTNLRDWIRTSAVDRYQIDPHSVQYSWIMGFVDILLSKPFGA